MNRSLPKLAVLVAALSTLVLPANALAAGRTAPLHFELENVLISNYQASGGGR